MPKNELDKIVAALQKAIETIISRQFRMQLGTIAREIIYRRTKSGYGVASDEGAVSQQRRLLPLSKSYTDFRKGEVAFFTRNGKVIPYTPKIKPKLGRFGSPSRSNLTFTGDMLESLQVELTAQGFVIAVPDTKRQDGKTNAQVARYASQARPFLALTEQEVFILEREIENKLREVTRRIKP